MNITPDFKFYKSLDEKFLVRNSNLERATYTSKVNFYSSVNYPRHRWFYYKEGFSPELVSEIFEKVNLSADDVVVDPFCGAGTTLLEAQKRGIKSFGFEINPFSHYISHVKTRNYSKQSIEEFRSYLLQIDKITIETEHIMPDNEYLYRLFSDEIMNVVLSLRDHMKRELNGESLDLVFFCWLTSLERLSNYRKAGNGLKKKAKPFKLNLEEAKELVINEIKKIADVLIQDLQIDEYYSEVPNIFLESAVNMRNYIENDTIDLVLFSPPYANCFDYTKIYYIELWFGQFIYNRNDQKEIRQDSVRSHVHHTWEDRYTNFYLEELHDVLIPNISEKKLWSRKIPNMLDGYFSDMNHVLSEIYEVLKPGGHCVIVVSNSAYAGVVVPTDTLLALSAEKIGFKVEEIEVDRLIITSSQQYKMTENMRSFLRESIIKLTKPNKR